MNAYEILECEPNATEQEIKNSYHRLLLKHHPDKATNSELHQSFINDTDSVEKDAAVDTFCRLQKAYKLLTSPVQRAEYDSRLRQEELKQQGTTGVAENDCLLLRRDFVHDTTSNLYSYGCRCGDYYTIDGNELERMPQESATAREQSCVISLECQTCSLNVNVRLV